MKRVLFVWMPWAAASWPSLSLGLLTSVLQRAGLPADVLYANLYMAGRLGDVYDRISRIQDVGEIFFAPFLYPDKEEKIRRRAVRLLDRLLEAGELDGKAEEETRATEGASQPPRAFLNPESLAADLFSAAEATLRWAERRIPEGRYDLVGFSCTFQQTLAALGLARRIKRHRPGTTIVMGGPAFHGEMGIHFLRFFPFLDFACLGEGEESIIPLVESIRSGAPMPREVPGIAFRGEDGEIHATPSRRSEDLDALPVPDYGDYMEQVHRLLPSLRPWIYFESSRGCSRGARRPCTFCGLNGTFTGFRVKSPGRVAEEIRTLAERYEVPSFRAADNLLVPKLLDRLAPELARFHEEYGFVFFYEVRSNLNARRIRDLRRAGILYTQPGIESFSDRVLSLMHKGTSAIRNIQFLKLCREEGIQCTYNIIYRIPGERAEDYREMRARLPFIRHLPPPSSVGALRLDRFSTYHARPRSFGIEGIRPPKIVRLAHAGLKEDLSEICFSFRFRLREDEDEELIRERNTFLQALASWRRTFRDHTLVYRRGPGHVRILDRRGEAPRTFVLRGPEAELFHFCREVHGPEAIARRFSSLTARAVEAFLQRMVKERLFYRDRLGRVIALPIRWKHPA